MRQFIPLLILLLSTQAHAQYGVPDPSFGIAGQVITPSGSPFSNPCNAVAQAPDGKLVIAGGQYQAGISSWVVGRYMIDGTVDTTFADSGFSVMPIGPGSSSAAAVAVQPDGKVVAAGVSDVGAFSAFTLVRYQNDGSLDTTFDQDGILTSSSDATNACAAYAIALQPDGKIIVGGEMIGSSESYAGVMRFNTDGTPDSTFSFDGEWYQNQGGSWVLYALALQPDGKIVYAGKRLNGANYEVLVGRLTDTGTSDGFVYVDAFSSSDVAYGVTLQPDGKIIACGSASGTYWTGRFNTDLTTDFSFGIGGWVSDSFSLNHQVARNCQVLPNGDILVSGQSAYCTSTCYQPNGPLQTSFGNAGYLNLYFPAPYVTARAGTLQADGKLVVVGDQNANFVLARVLLDFNVGVLQFASTGINTIIYPNPIQAQGVMRYSLEMSERITITLRDVEGRSVRTIVDGEDRAAGAHEQIIDLGGLPAGMYVVELDNGHGSMSVRVSKP